MPGKLIVLEGLDGSGKATQTALLVERLKKEGHNVETIDFPQYTQTFFGPLIQQYLQGAFGKAGEVSPHFAAILYALDRYETKEKIQHWLQAGKIVVANRYTTSNMGHQAGKIKDSSKRKEFLTWLDKLEYDVLGIPKPDLVIFLYVEPKIAQQLAKKRGAQDMHEQDSQHQKQTEQAFLMVAQEQGWIRIDCTNQGHILSREQIHEHIWGKVRHLV